MGNNFGKYAAVAIASLPSCMYSNPEIAKWHADKFGAQHRFGYKDFIPLFKAEKFDPDQWATLFKKAGARYIVPTAEHHDGFAMYDTHSC